jgi:glycosyltransferase involved in cell wall biosynthesis
VTRPRLVHVTTTDISLALLLGPQLRAFADAGYDVIGVSAPGPFVEQLRAAGIEHEPLRHATRAVAPYRDAAALVELRRLFRRLRPDIVHTHNPKPGLYGRLAARWAGVPAVVNTVHGLYATADDGRAKRAVVYRLERLAARCSQAELVQNPEDMATLAAIGVPAAKLHLLGNGVDLDRFRPPTADQRSRARADLGVGDDDVVVGVVGRLVREKGYPELFQAAGVVPVPVVFVVAGPDDDAKADAITASDRATAEANGVRLLGFRHDVERLYHAMDVYVLASHREGFPRSAMEASASGLPIVATDIRGCRQVVDHGRTGLLVPPRDPAGLAAAITRLATDATLRLALGRAGQDKAIDQFDQQAVIDRTLAVYQSLLARAPA